MEKKRKKKKETSKRSPEAETIRGNLARRRRSITINCYFARGVLFHSARAGCMLDDDVNGGEISSDAEKTRIGFAVNGKSHSGEVRRMLAHLCPAALSLWPHSGGNVDGHDPATVVIITTVDGTTHSGTPLGHARSRSVSFVTFVFATRRDVSSLSLSLALGSQTLCRILTFRFTDRPERLTHPAPVIMARQTRSTTMAPWLVHASP